MAGDIILANTYPVEPTFGRARSIETFSAPRGCIFQTRPLPNLALQQRGPVVQVRISLERSFAQALLSQGKTLPPAESGFALIDTGASQTCIDEAAQRLGLPVIDVAMMTSASHLATKQNLYPVQIEITGLPISIGSGANLKPQGILLLIGRDVLARLFLFTAERPGR